MRLLIDIGNTRVKWLCIVPGAVISVEKNNNAFTHHQDFITAYEVCFGVGSEFEQQLLGLSLTEVVVSNVAGDPALTALTLFSEKSWQITPFYVAVSKRFAGIYNDYKMISELGVDRWVAIIGARQYVSEGAVILINCGTAITVDILTEGNHFLGGAILPGFQLAANSLSRADGIAEISAEIIQKIIGESTKECVQLGVIAACVGGVESIVNNIQMKVLSDSPRVLLSGGAAPLFLDASSLECEYDANVIIRGLDRVVECES